MATSLHNSPATWLTLCVRDVQRTVQESARCGTPLLLVHGDGRIKYPGGTSQPDNRIDVNVHFQHNGEADTYCVPEPRVVLETAFSQPLQDAEDKAWEYLCTGDGHTHAVIVVDMSYPVTPQKDFKAKIAVWSRQDTGDDGRPVPPLPCFNADLLYADVDYPFEASEEYPHEPLPTPEEEHSPESPGGSNASSLAGSGSATLISEGTTKVDDIHPPRSICKKAADGSDWTIETPGYIVSRIPARIGATANHFDQVFLDEKKDAHPDTSSPPGFELLLDTFHFLRRCPKHPRDIPRPSEVSLPLAPLRSCVMEALVRHRDEQWPWKRKADVAVEDAGESTSPENVDSAAMRSKTPPMLRKWKQVKKSRRGA